MTIGIALDSIPPVLTRVAAEHAAKPVHSFDALGAMGGAVRRYMEHVHESVDLVLHGDNLPAAGYANLNDDQLAKLLASLDTAIDSCLRDALDERPVQLLVRKIRSSMWRWGTASDDWNEVVDAYEGLRSFDLGIPGFTATLDHTSWYNERGWGVHSEIYLDGVFAFLIHWKGEHVMTVGLSIANCRTVLLHQIQMTRRTGNRWLFKMPHNRVEFIIDRIAAAFPGHKLHIVDGNDIADHYLSVYRRGRDTIARRTDDLRRRLEAGLGDLAMIERTLRKQMDEDAVLSAKIDHLAADRPRLADLYRATGRYARGKALKRNDMRHYALAA